ncbi:replicative DNA helicase, partial [Vibrio parahaemolyticus EKP-028]
AFNIPRTTLAL